MARQNIQFRGLRHTPSDITGQDGDLLECVNLIHENGELKPIEMPERMQQPNSSLVGEILVTVHNITDGKKFVFARIVQDTLTNIVIKNESGQIVYTHSIMGKIQWVEAIGNTLIFGTNRSTHYALYKNGAYKWLGDKLPQPVFEFDMGANSDSECYEVELREPIPYTTYTNGDTGPDGGICVHNLYAQTSGSGDRYTQLFPDSTVNTDENRKIIRDNLRAKMATLMHDSKNAGRFVYPFLARYAVRLYDGNYVMHSAPILLLPSSNICPILAYLSMKGLVVGDHYSFSDLLLTCNTKPMTLKFVGFVGESGNDVTSTIGEWEDIIKGVDVFLSSQIVTFNDSYYDNLDNVPSKYYTIGGLTADYGSAYSQNTKENWLTNHQTNGFDITETYNIFYKNQYFPLQSYSADYIQERVSETNLFYRVKKYDLSKISSAWQEEKYLHDEIEYGLLERLETLPTLPDDYVSRSRIVGNANYNYNQRLILGNIQLQAPLWYYDTKTFGAQNYNVQIWFEIEKPEKTIRVQWAKNNVGLNDFGHYLYYPDPDCKRAIIDTDAYHVVVPMSEHTGLHGAYALMPDLESLWESASNDDLTPYTGMLPTASTPEQRYYSMQNTIAMSSVANPFHFPATNFKDIGRAKVIGIAANMLDVSSAQWGQYPIYVFCSDGIIAVMIDGEGKMGGIQAVSADVLREPLGLSKPTVVQTGQALMFLTQRGVMTIGGTKIGCMSEAMNGRHFKPLTELMPTNSVIYPVSAWPNLIQRTADSTAFQDFAASGFLAYDYAHHRVLLLRGDKDYQYVFSLNTGMWSKQIVYTNLSTLQMDTVPSNQQPDRGGNDTYPVRELKVKPICGAVNNYTEMYLQDTEGWLYKTMEVQGENSVKQIYQYGYLISRPIRFGTDEYKTLNRVLHRYNHFAANSFVRMAVYGSRDGVKYGRINTLRGMSYQYFIFVIYTYLKPNERYSYMSVDFEPRLTNKLR